MLGGLLELLWPRVCPVCDDESPLEPVHSRCLERIGLAQSTLGRGTEVVACFEDGPEWFRLLHRWKYGGEAGLVAVVARTMADRAPAIRGRVVLVPMPDDPVRRLQRGFGPVADLCAMLSDLTGWPVDPAVLRRRGARPAQARCQDDRARQSNVSGAFRTGDLSRRTSATTFLLVEDQVTSGATVSEAVPLLRARGARVVVWCAARAARSPLWLP
jgi:predicted amidophosphoribosyltransferase